MDLKLFVLSVGREKQKLRDARRDAGSGFYSSTIKLHIHMQSRNFIGPTATKTKQRELDPT